jgi:leucyl-tRNA synthetase
LDNIGFSFDWSREFAPAIPKYYKWTQWIFCNLLIAGINREKQKAERIEKARRVFEKEGNKDHPVRMQNSR